jgi:type IV pilus assembly protein PilA
MLSKLKKARGFTLIELMIVVAIIGILSAVAIPNFIRFQARSKQSEAKTNLKAIFTAQKAYFGERDRYTSNLQTVGFTPEAGNRYSYGMQAAVCARLDASAARTTTDCVGQDSDRFANVPAPVSGGAGTIGVTGTCPTCDFTASAAGNVDNDGGGDTWFISSTTISLTGTCGTDQATAVGGEPGNAVNDVSCNQ